MAEDRYADRRFWIVVALLIVAGTALRYPAFGHDFAADDYAQLAMMEGVYPSPRGPLSLFTFSSGERDDVQRLMDSGFYPWFSHPELRLSMMRPLGSALMWVDHGLFGRWAPGYHLHSLLWWWLLLATSALVFRRLLGDRLGLLAFALFLLDETHGVMMGWIANRNAIVAVLLCLLALERHVRARSHGQRSPPSVLLLYALALCAGEYALCMLGYFVAYELVEARGALRERVRALSPLLGLSLAFLALRSALGYGSYGSDLYVDPTRTPLAFIEVAVARFPVLMSDLVLAVRSDWWTFGVPPPFQLEGLGWAGDSWLDRLMSWRRVQERLGWIGLALAVGCAVLAMRGLRARVEERAAAPVLGPSAASAPGARAGLRVGWLALGALLSALPPLVTAPSTRSLVGPAWGFAAVLAALLTLVPFWWRQRRPARALLATALLVIHLLIGPWIGFWDTVQMAQIANVVRFTALATPPIDGDLQGRRVIFLSSAEPITPIYFSLIRKLHDRGAPRSTWLLCPASSVFDLSRPTPSSLEVYLPAQTMLDGGFERIFRSARAPVKVGHRFRVDGMEVTVLELRDGNPSRMRYEFDAPLDDPQYVVMASTAFGLRSATLPAVGRSVRIGPPQLPTSAPRD